MNGTTCNLYLKHYKLYLMKIRSLDPPNTSEKWEDKLIDLLIKLHEVNDAILFIIRYVLN